MNNGDCNDDDALVVMFDFNVCSIIIIIIIHKGDVKYGKFGQQSLHNLLELRVPTEKAVIDMKLVENGNSSVNAVINKRPRIDLLNKSSSSSSSSNKESDEKDEIGYEFIQKSDVVENNDNNSDNSSAPTTATTTSKEIETFIPFNYCLDSFVQPEIIDMFHPTMNCNTSCARTLRFKTFPKYLMMKMARYYIR